MWHSIAYIRIYQCNLTMQCSVLRIEHSICICIYILYTHKSILQTKNKYFDTCITSQVQPPEEEWSRLLLETLESHSPKHVLKHLEGLKGWRLRFQLSWKNQWSNSEQERFLLSGKLQKKFQSLWNKQHGIFTDNDGCKIEQGCWVAS